MSTQVLKARLFEEREIPTKDGDVLHAKLMLPKPPSRPQRVLFIAPLIGAGAAQSLLVFRNLSRRGSILLSFEYRGHPRSTGTFELDKTLADVRDALVWAWGYASDRGLPLHGLSTCYGTVPLLAQFAGNGCGALLRTFCAASGLFRLDHILRLSDFAPFLSRYLGRELSAAACLEEIAMGRIDCSESAFRQALYEFLKVLFPQLRVEPGCFEELEYDRVDLGRTLLQFSRANYLEGATVPPWIPCHFFYGRNDKLMLLDTPEGQSAYERHVRSLIPHASLHPCDVDHFGRGPDRDWLINSVGDICEQYDAIPIPPCHFNPHAPLQSAQR